MSGILECTEGQGSWYVILPPPVELGPCRIRTHLPKRSSQNSILSTASLRLRDISGSPALSDGAPSEGGISVSTLEEDKVDGLEETMGDRNNRAPNGDDVIHDDDMNGNDEVITESAMDSGLADGSNWNATMDVTGGLSREQFPDESGGDDISTSYINIRLNPTNPDEISTRRAREQGIMGGLQVGDGDIPRNAAVQDAVAEMSGGNLAVSLSQHSTEDTPVNVTSQTGSHAIEVRPETIISPLRMDSSSSTHKDDSTRGDSLYGKDSFADRTPDLQRSDLIGTDAETSRHLSEHSMEDTTQPTLSGHPIDSTSQGTFLSEYPIGFAGSHGESAARLIGSSQTSQDLSEHPMESTARTTLSEFPIDNTTQGTIDELSQYPMDHTKTSLRREEPVGQHRLRADSNENVVGSDSDSYASQHSRDASTVVRHVIGGCDTSNDTLSKHSSSRASSERSSGMETNASADTRSHDSRPSSRSSAGRTSAASSVDDSVRKTTFSESFSSRDRSANKSMESVRSKQTFNVDTGVPPESRIQGGAISKDTLGSRRNAEQSVKVKDSLVKTLLDVNISQSIPGATGGKSDGSLVKTMDANAQQSDVQQTMGVGQRLDAEYVLNKPKNAHVSKGQASSGMSDVPGASSQFRLSSQSRTSNEMSMREVASSRSSSTSLNMELSQSAASSSQGGFRIHGVDDRHNLSPKVSPEGAEASDEDSAISRVSSQASRVSSQNSRILSQNRNMPMLPPSAISSSQPGRAYLNLDDLQTQDALADKVAVLLGDAIVTTLSRDRPGVGDGGSSSEAGTPDSIETEKSEKALVSRERTPDVPAPGFTPRESMGEDRGSARSGGGSVASYTDSLADRVAHILAESDAIRQIQAYQHSVGGSVSPTPSDVSTSSSVRAIIDKVLLRTAAGAGYVSGDDASSVTSDIPSYPMGGNQFEYDSRQPMSPMRANLSKSMSVPMGSPYSPESARRSPSPRPPRDDNLQYSPRPQSGGYRGSVASYQTADTLDHQVQNLLAHTAYIDQSGLPPAYSPGRESPRSFYGRQSPAPSPRLTTFERVRQGEVPLRRHSATGIPRPVPYQGEHIGAGGDQGFYLRMEPEGRSSLVKRSNQPGIHSSQIPVASGGAGHMSPTPAQMYRRPPDRSRSVEHTEPPQSPRGQYVESPAESMDSLSHRVREILSANLPQDRPPMLQQEPPLTAGDFPLPEGGLQAVWQAKVAAGQMSRTSVQSTPYSSTHVSPRSSHHGTPRSGSPRGFAHPMDPSSYMETESDDVGLPPPEYAGGAFDRARNLLSNQLQRATDMTFNHSVEVRDPFAARMVARNQPRRTSNGQDQYSSSPRASPLMSPRMHPAAAFGSRHVREAWGEEYQSQEDLHQQPGYYGSMPDDLSPALPEDSGHFYPLRPYSSPTKSFQPVPASSHDYHSLPRSFAKSPRHAMAHSVDSSQHFGPLGRSVSTSDIDVAHPHSRVHPHQIPDMTDPHEMDAADMRYKTWEADVLTAKARMSPRPDRATSIPVPVPGSPRGYRRSMSRESDHRMSPDPRMSPRTSGMYKPTAHGSLPAKLNSPLGRDAYGTSNIKPYRPPGSTELQYTYPLRMDEELTSNQTMESSHPGSDDAQPPVFPPGTLGSRRDHPATMTSLPSPHGQSRLPMYNRDGTGSGRTSPHHSEHANDRLDRSKPARSYIEYPSDLRSDDVSDATPKSPETQFRSRGEIDERYQDQNSPRFQSAPQGQFRQSEASNRTSQPLQRAASADMSSPTRSAYDRPQSPMTGYSGCIPVRRQQDNVDARSADIDYGMLPPASQADDNMNLPPPVARIPQTDNIVRDLPPLHPSARGNSGYRRASDTASRAPGGGTSRYGQQGSDVPPPAGNYSRKVLQDVLQNESDPRYAEMGQMWDEYESFRNNNEGAQSSLDSERIRQVADILEDPVRHTVTKWTKLDDQSDTQSESSYDSRRRRKRWEKEQPFSPAQLNTSYDKEQAFVVTKHQRNIDQSSTTLDTTMLPPSSMSGEEEWYPQKQEKKKRHEEKPEAMRHGSRHQGSREPYLRHPDQSVPDKDESRLEDSSHASVDTLLSDMSLESDQLYRLLSASGVRKLSSKLVRLQNKIDKQKEHHRKREEHAATRGVDKKRSGDPKMFSTPARQEHQAEVLQRVVDTVKGAKVKTNDPSGHTLSPVAERSHETVELPSQIASESALSEQQMHEQRYLAAARRSEKVRREPYREQHRDRLTEHQIKKLERRRRHRHVNYRDDFHVSYGSDTLTDSLSDGSVPCTCRPRRARSLQDIAAKSRSKAAVTIEPKSHVIRKGTFKKPSVPTRGGRLPSRIPVHSADEMRDASPSPAPQRSAEPHRTSKGTAFVITFPSDKGKGKNETKQTAEADEGAENRTKPKRHLQYKHRGLADGSNSGKLEPVAWFQPFNKKMPWQQQDTSSDPPPPPRKPLQDTQPPALKREGTKTMVKLTLQEALEEKRGDFISRSRERQKLVHLAAEERHTQIQNEAERNKLFQDKRTAKANTQAHPYSDQLHKPKKRNLSRKEIKEHTKKLYSQLPEVVQRNEDEKRLQTYQTNRIKAQVYRKKLSDRIKGKAWNDD